MKNFIILFLCVLFLGIAGEADRQEAKRQALLEDEQKMLEQGKHSATVQNILDDLTREYQTAQKNQHAAK